MSLDAFMIVDNDIALISPFKTFGIMQEVVNERAAQDAKWGQQDHPDGTGRAAIPLKPLGGLFKTAPELARIFTASTDARFAGIGDRPGSWSDILLEEVFEALAESDPAALRTELLQVAAVASAWAEAITRRGDAA